MDKKVSMMNLFIEILWYYQRDYYITYKRPKCAISYGSSNDLQLSVRSTLKLMDKLHKASG